MSFCKTSPAHHRFYSVSSQCSSFSASALSLSGYCRFREYTYVAYQLLAFCPTSLFRRKLQHLHCKKYISLLKPVLSQAWNTAWRLLFAAINSLRKLKTTTNAVFQQDSDSSFSFSLGSKCNAICNNFFLPFIFEKQVVLYCAWLIFLAETQVSRAAFIHLFSTSMIMSVFLRCYSVHVSPLHYSPPPWGSSAPRYPYKSIASCFSLPTQHVRTSGRPQESGLAQPFTFVHYRPQWTWKSSNKRGSLNLCCFLSISSTSYLIFSCFPCLWRTFAKSFLS